MTIIFKSPSFFGHFSCKILGFEAFRTCIYDARIHLSRPNQSSLLEMWNGPGITLVSRSDISPLGDQNKNCTQSGKGRQDLKKLLLLGPPNSNNLGNFLQHMQKSECFSDVFWRNCDLKFFPYKTSCDREARITKWSVWRSSLSEKSH